MCHLKIKYGTEKKICTIHLEVVEIWKDEMDRTYTAEAT
jgi:hypothetical protein